MAGTPPSIRVPHRGGIALLAVVVVVALMATAALTFALLMQQNNQTARDYADQQQGQWAVDAALAQMLGLASLPAEQRQQMAAAGSAMFVQSLALEAPASDAGGVADSSLGGGAGASGDWTTGAMGAADSEMTVDWETALTDNSIVFDPTQPGFAIFDWRTAGQVRAGAAGRGGSGLSGGMSGGFGGSGGLGGGLSGGLSGGLGTGDSAELELEWGWTNESSKLHLAKLMEWEAAGTAASPILQQWCGLNPQQADRLLDWLDGDGSTRAFGAEASDYEQLGLRYSPLNRVPTSLELLLLVPGFSPQQVFGRNQATSIRIVSGDGEDGALDSDASGLAQFGRSQAAQIERDLQPEGAELDAADRATILALGLTSRLTVSSRQRHVNRRGQPQLPVNHSNLQALFAAVSARLEPGIATYLCLARQYGVQPGSVTSFGSGRAALELDGVELDFSLAATANLASLVTLVDSHVAIPRGGDEGVWIVNSPLQAATLQGEFAAQVAAMFEELTVANEAFSVGKIHWRLADPALIALIPGLNPQTRELLLMADQDEAATAEETPAGTGLAQRLAVWYQAGRLTPSQWQVLERELTDGGDVFSAYVFGHAGDYRAIRWAHVSVDASEKPPRQLDYRELLPPPPTLQALLAKLNENVLANP